MRKRFGRNIDFSHLGTACLSYKNHTGDCRVIVLFEDRYLRDLTIHGIIKNHVLNNEQMVIYNKQNIFYMIIFGDIV